MYIFDKESLSKFGDSKHLPKNIGDSMKFMLEIAWNRQFLVTYVWNRQLFAAIPYKATAALTNTCKYQYIELISKEINNQNPRKMHFMIVYLHLVKDCISLTRNR